MPLETIEEKPTLPYEKQLDEISGLPTREEKIDALLKLLGEHHKDTLNHSLRVKEIVVRIAHQYPPTSSLTDEQISQLVILHDIGKLAVNTAIIDKMGPLDENEMAIMKQHPEWGKKILIKVGLNDASIVALEHHERYNGSGYPKGLKGDKIDPLAQITSLVDVFDALTDPARRYRKPLSTNDALAEIEKEFANGAYNPALKDIFEKEVRKTANPA